MARQKSRYALLGLLHWKPMSGYDIKKLVDLGLSHFWNENYGQIYPTLEALVDEGLAKKNEDRTRQQRKRFVYTITAKGRQAFRAWLSAPTSMPAVRNELQLKFFLSGVFPVDQSVRLIREYQTQQQGVLAEYRRSEKVLAAAVQHGKFSRELQQILDLAATTKTRLSRVSQCRTFLFTLRHGIRVAEARLAWCSEVLKELEK